MARMYGEAEQVKEIADQLIPHYHPEIASARIGYVSVDKASKKNGKPVLGKARKVSGVWEHLVELDFLIEVAQDQWNPATNRQRHALVDHLLECCTGVEDEKTGEMKWTMRSPDVNEFTAILQRHGAWHEELEGLVQVAQQLNLDARIQEVEDDEVQQLQGEF